jgi:DNA-binding NtrC family response regulator
VKRILLISTDAGAARRIEDAFVGYEVVVSGSVREAASRRGTWPVAIVDVRVLSEGGGRPEGWSCEEALGPLLRRRPPTHVVALAPDRLMREVVMAVKAGAVDYLTLPLRDEEVAHALASVEKATLPAHVPDHMAGGFWNADVLDVVDTRSATMERAFTKIRQVARTRSTVLLTGETGTGKSFLARVVHAHSSRRDGPFVSVHCGAIPETLVESELFGHEKGAFTGADKLKPGRFETADGGTLLLDEVGTIGPQAQVKLLDVLHERRFTRVGGDREIEADVRIIAATNLDLERACERGEFRRDLYYRLNVFPVHIPPLRERRGDVTRLAALFLRRFAALHGKDLPEMDPGVLELLERYDWPGNVRELESAIERAVIVETADRLTPESFDLPGAAPASTGSFSGETLAQARRRVVEELERAYLTERLRRHAGRIAETAREAGITVRQLHKLMSRHGLRKEDFRRRR